MARVFTIGHSNRQWGDFISILKDNHIDLLVDVRRYRLLSYWIYYRVPC